MKAKKKRIHHHIKNRVNGGHSNPENLLYVSEDKEKMIHKLFGDRDFYEIIIFILRLSKMKHYETVNSKIKRFYKFIK